MKRWRILKQQNVVVQNADGSSVELTSTAKEAYKVLKSGRKFVLLVFNVLFERPLNAFGQSFTNLC